MVVFLAARMVSKTLVIKTREMQLSRMFHLRPLFSSAKDIYFLVVLLSTISIIIACKPCAAKEVQNQCEFKRCRSYNGNFDSLFVADSNVGSGLVSGNPVRLHGLEHLCHPSNAFCFPSTLSGFEDDEILTALEELDDSEIQSEVFSSGFKGKSNLSQLPYHGNFRFWGGRNISCSLYREDTFPEFSSGQNGTRNVSRTDVSSCVNSLFGKKTSNFISFRNNESIFSIGDGLSTPLVDIKPSVLDWGHRNMYHPAIAYFTVTNLDADNILKVHDCFSSDSQFYPCESSAGLLAPGENASICFVFLPTRLGRVSAKLIIETSFGGLLIHARGFSVESPHLINLHGDLEISPGGRWRKSVSLFNSFDDKLHVEEVTAWLSISSGNTSRSSGSICRAQSKEYSSHYNVLNAKDWLVVERGEGGKPKIGLRPHENWVVGPKKTEKLMELDISGHFEGKIVGALCMQLLKFPNSVIDIVVVLLEVELSLENAASNTSLISLSLEALIPCNTSKLTGIALSVRNDAPYSLSVIKVTQEGESKAGFHIKSLEGVILFPSTTTIVAFINYGQLGTDEVYPSCKITVLVNGTSFNLLEIPCTDVIGVCSGCVLDSSVRNIQGINVDYRNGGERFFSNKHHISYHIDFAAATVQRDLELVLATGGILVIPVKAIIPMCLIDLCRRSMFWIRFRKVMVVLLFAASLMYFMVSLLFPCITTASESQDIGMGKSSFSSMINKFSSLHIRFNWRRCERGPLFPEMNRTVESIQEEALLSGCCEGLSPDKGNANSSSEISSPSSVLNLDTRDKPESHGLRVTVGKEKGRRRRKKKSSGFRILLSEPTSTQSGNSTPSSPLSLTSTGAPKKPCRNPVLEARNPFSCAPIEQSNRSKFPEISSKVNRVVDTDALKFKCDSNFLGPSTREKQSLTRKAASRAAIVPSSAFPSCSGGSLPPWAYCSVSNSPIAPLARSPGANLQTRPNNACEVTMGDEQNYTYDIWGDHLFGLPLTHQSRKVSSEPSRSSNENDSDSFFVRGPQTLVRNTLLQSVISEDILAMRLLGSCRFTIRHYILILHIFCFYVSTCLSIRTVPTDSSQIRCYLSLILHNILITHFCYFSRFNLLSIYCLMGPFQHELSQPKAHAVLMAPLV